MLGISTKVFHRYLTSWLVKSNSLSPLSIPDAPHLFPVLINDPSLPKLIWHPHHPSTSKCSKQGSFSMDCSFRHFFPQTKNPITSVTQHVILFWFYFSDYSLWLEKKKCFNLRCRTYKGLWGWVHNLQLHITICNCIKFLCVGMCVFSGFIDFYLSLITDNFPKPKLLSSRYPLLPEYTYLECGLWAIIGTLQSFMLIHTTKPSFRQTFGLSNGLWVEGGYFLRPLLQQHSVIFVPKDLVQKGRLDRASHSLDCAPEEANALAVSLG